MPRFQDKSYKQVLSTLSLIERRDDAALEVRYYSEPQNGEEKGRLSPEEVEKALKNGQTVIAYNEDMGNVPFGRLDSGEMAYGKAYLDNHKVEVPPAPKRPGFWSSFANFFGYKTKAQKDYDRAVKERREAVSRAELLEKCRTGIEAVKDVEEEFRNYQEMVQGVMDNVAAQEKRAEQARIKAAEEKAKAAEADLDNNLRIDDVIRQNEAEMEAASDAIPEEYLQRYEEGRKAIDALYAEEEEGQAAPAQKESNPIDPTRIARNAQLHKEFFDFLVKDDSLLEQAATGMSYDDILPTPEVEAFTWLTSPKHNIRSYSPEQREALVRRMDGWVAHNRPKLQKTVDAMEKVARNKGGEALERAQKYQEFLKNLTGAELVDRLDAMQTTKIAGFESKLPMKKWPAVRADKTEYVPAPYPEETEKSRAGQALVDERCAQAYDVLGQKRVKKDALANAVATILVGAALRAKTPEMARALELNACGLGEMPQDAPRRNKLSQRIADQARRNIAAREQFSAAKPQEFDKAVETFCKKPGFRELIGNEEALRNYCSQLKKAPNGLEKARAEAALLGKINHMSKQARAKSGNGPKKQLANEAGNDSLNKDERVIGKK